MAKPNQETPIYKAWCPEDDEDETTAREYGALDVEFAAKLWADHYHAHRGGWEARWPIVVRVRDPDGKLWDVEVERRQVPDFVPGKPRPVS